MTVDCKVKRNSMSNLFFSHIVHKKAAASKTYYSHHFIFSLALLSYYFHSTVLSLALVSDSSPFSLTVHLFSKPVCSG